MRSILVIIACLSIMLLGLFGTASILLDEDRVKSLVARHIENHTGHRVEIQGALKLRFFPGLNLSAEQVVLSRPDVVDGPAIFTSDNLDMQVRLLPLIRGKVDATEIRLGGVRINYGSGSPGSDSEAASVADRPDDGMHFAGPIFLDGVVVSNGDSGSKDRNTLEFDQVMLSGFAFGQPLQFAFRGSIGEPGLFEDIEIDGLMVFDQTGRMRLSNMRLRGSMDDGLYDIGLLGNATFSVSPFLHFSVDSGRLKINDQEFELDMAYRATERPHLSADIVADFLDADVADILGFMAALPYEPTDSAWLTTLRGMDFEVSIKAGGIAREGMVVEDVSLAASGVGGEVRIESMRAGIPAGLVTGKGELDLRQPDPRWRINLLWELASLERSLDAMQLDWNLDGAGSVTLDLESASPNGDPAPIPWIGTGHIELWDGQWPLLGELAPHSSVFSSVKGFDYLQSSLTFQPSQLVFSGLQLVSDGVVIEGDVMVALPGEGLTGRMHVAGENGELVAVQVGGTINKPGVRQVPFGSPPSP